MYNLLKSLWQFFIYKMKDQSGNIGKMFTPPKSKSPYEALTKGSSGGWANFMAPGKWGGFVGPLATTVAGIIPYVGPALSAAMGAAGTMGGKGSWLGDTGYQGSDYSNQNWLPTIMGGISGYGAGSLGRGISSGIGNAMSSGMTKAGSAAIGNKFVEGFGTGMSSYGLNSPGAKSVMSQFTGGGGTPSAASLAQNANLSTLQPYTGTSAYGAPYSLEYMGANPLAAGIIGGGVGQSVGGGVGGGISGATGGNATTGIASKFNLPQVAGGALVSAIPSMLGQETTEIPISPMIGDATSKLLGGQGISEIGALGRQKLTANLNKEFSPVTDEYFNAATRRLNEAYDKQEESFTKQFQALRPGANVESDSAYRSGLNELRQNRAQELSSVGAELEYRQYQDYLNQQYQNIQSALNVDQQTMQDYLSLAQLDANRIATNTGISLGEAQQFKQIFGDLGSALMQSGMGLNDPTAALQNLFKRYGGGTATA